MTIRATAGFNFLRYDPGNPEFPTLPDGVIVPHVLDYQTGGGDKRTRQAYSSTTKFISASAPANDTQRYGGWQTETTWINPATVDFGVIPSPVQRTVSLYNARTVPIEVTALSLPTGVTLVSPSLPVTLFPYDGVTFIIEAGITGESSFDETSTFTTSVGLSTFRTIGRRVFTLNVIPQAPMSETLKFRTELLRSKDGTEKAYSLLQAPNAMIDYRVFFTDDLQRIRFKNNFIAGESALVVSGQKWYEARILRRTAQATDTTLDLITNAVDASWQDGGPISVVTEDGTTVEAVLDSTENYPDPYIDLNTLILRFEGADGSQTTGDDGPLNLGDLTWFASGNPEISTTQSKWGNASYFGGTSFPSFAKIGAKIGENMPHFLDNDWTIDFWVYPIVNFGCPLSRWISDEGGRDWRIILSSTAIQLTLADPSLTYDFTYNSPSGYLGVGQWNYVRIARSGSDIRAFMNGVEAGTPLNVAGSIKLSGAGPLPVLVGNYYSSGFVLPYNGYIDDVRITIGIARSITDFTPPTAPHEILEDQNLRLNLNGEIGTTIPAGSRVMPVGLGYVSKFPTYSTYRDNLEVVDYTLTFNQESDFGALDLSFVTLVDQQSPQSTLVVLEFCNEISRSLSTQLKRQEDVLGSGLSNRIAYSVHGFADHVSDFTITLYSEAEVWKWRTFIHYLRGSYGDFYVPTFTDDIPGVTTAASNVFVAADTDLSLLFGNPPNPRRNAIRLQYPDGTILYRFITAVVDNGATEQITVDSSVVAGNPKISYLQRSRILADTVSFTHNRNDYAVLKFKFRTILK